MHGFLGEFLVVPTHTGTETLAIVLRWIHFLAGITWIGLLYFFNLVNIPFMKQVDAALKPKVFQHLTLPTLPLFRWSSLVTVLGPGVRGPRCPAGRKKPVGNHWPVPAGMAGGIWPLFPSLDENAQSVAARAGSDRADQRRVMGLCDLHSSRRRRQSRTLHRHRRRHRPFHDDECLGSGLAV